MPQLNRTAILSVGFAIFSMLFGAGNLMYPLQVGTATGSYMIVGMISFLITAVCLPVLGLISMILFAGDYKRFFLRLGFWAGNITLFLCILIIGPVIALPRIVTVSHTMIAPFLPFEFLQLHAPFSSGLFAVLFLGITFLTTYKERRIMSLLGNIIGPVLLACLSIIIIKGFFGATTTFIPTKSALEIIKDNFILGYQTLDLLGAIFFASIVISLMRSFFGDHINQRHLARIGFKASMIGITLLAIVYLGMGLLGMYYGHLFTGLDAGELFREIAFTILHAHGAIIIATAVLFACLSTSIALSAVVAEYLQKYILQGAISFEIALLITLISAIPLSIFGLKEVLLIAGGPLVYVGYPVVIALTICNLLYMACGFKPVKLPVLLTFVCALLSYYVW